MSKSANCFSSLEEFMSHVDGMTVQDILARLSYSGIEEAHNLIFNHGGFAFVQNPKTAQKICEVLDLYPIFYSIEVVPQTEDFEVFYSTQPLNTRADGYLLCQNKSCAVCVLN